MKCNKAFEVSEGIAKDIYLEGYKQGGLDAFDECIAALDVCNNCPAECKDKSRFHDCCMADVNVPHSFIVRTLEYLKKHRNLGRGKSTSASSLPSTDIESTTE